MKNNEPFDPGWTASQLTSMHLYYSALLALDNMNLGEKKRKNMNIQRLEFERLDIVEVAMNRDNNKFLKSL